MQARLNKPLLGEYTNFLKGYIAAFLTVIIVIFINNVLLMEYDTFSSRAARFAEGVPSILIFGHYYVLPGCILGEWVYRKFAVSKRFLTGFVLFALLGFAFGIIISGFQLNAIILAITIVGSVLFFCFRRDRK
ncbi:hypothetical protein [Bacillus sp. EB01]|uniref:hypothetical protein n=1 Tax=Bacillus sp. EB01 TaxID=1347086 RepID=UPI0005C4DF34|nr:hypothetical protein [Bacillus sp. EB01]